MITAEVETRLYEYMGGIIKDLGLSCLEINGMPDHVHLILRDSKSVDDVKVVKEIKSSSSRWVNETMNLPGRFAWQTGYGWFSVGPADLEQTRSYVKQQKNHHKKVTFQDELRKFLRQYGVEYDERYVWD